MIDRDLGYAKVAEAFRSQRSFVEVGIFGPKARAPKQTRAVRNADGKVTQRAASATLVEIAGYHEFGTTKVGGHTPQRSFLAAWFDENRVENIAFARDLADRRIAGKLGVAQSLALLGVRAVGGIVKRIGNTSILPRLARATVRRKNSEQTLVDTGQLRSSIAYRVVPR